MATESYSVDTSYHHQRRDSASSKSSKGGRRPRLLRSYATEPSITTENASKGVMTSPTYSTRRATELLSRVAISSNHASPSVQSSRSSVLESERMTQTSHESRSYFPLLRTRSVSISSGSEADSEVADSACYFSFPSFDTWDEERTQDEKKALEGS
ncbi:hypothetical protein GGR57DRAFT_68623 [Xylariaceae sp. FL1272]|nr:hypothetical protein GGR57DRAFT_68623 [Xylariaceae sp. FL1272]